MQRPTKQWMRMTHYSGVRRLGCTRIEQRFQAATRTGKK